MEDNDDPLANGDDFLGFGDSGGDDRKAAVSREITVSSDETENPLILRPLSEVPWGRVRGRAEPPLLTLHNEILDFCDFLSPTRSEIEERRKVADKVKETVRDIWPDYRIEPFGSELTKVYLPESDIDMVCLPPQELHVGRVRTCLFNMADRFKQDPDLAAVEVIASARVPIIKLRFNNNVQVDVSFSSDSGIRSGYFMQDMMAEMPPLRPLVLVLKYFLAQRGMNETFTGGMGSFMLQLMIISFLQHHKKEGDLWSKSRPTNLGSLLLAFLRLYGLEFNYEEVGMSTLGEGLYFSKLQRGFFNTDRQALAAVENPLDTTMDVGKNSYRMHVLKQAFAEAYTRVHTALSSRQNNGPPQSLLGLIIRSDEVLSCRTQTKRPIFKTRDFPAFPRASNPNASRKRTHEEFEAGGRYNDGVAGNDRSGRYNTDNGRSAAGRYNTGLPRHSDGARRGYRR